MARRVSDWIKVRSGDTVVDLHDERFEGRVVAVFWGYDARIKWDNGWLSDVPIARLRRLNPRNILYRA